MTVRIDTDNGRFYDTPAGLFPSVTSIINVIDKPALRNWVGRTERERGVLEAGRLFAEVVEGKKLSVEGFRTALQARVGRRLAADDTVKRAQDIGTAIHAAVEQELRREMGLECEPTPAGDYEAEVASAVDAWQTWRHRVKLRPLAIEQTVYSASYGYAGSFDLFAEMEIPGIGLALTVLDWKSGKGIYESAYLQNAAYAHAIVEMKEAEPPIHGAIVRLPKKAGASVEVHYIHVDDQRVLFDIFKSALRLWTGMREVETLLRKARA